MAHETIELANLVRGFDRRMTEAVHLNWFATQDEIGREWHALASVTPGLYRTAALMDRG